MKTKSLVWEKLFVSIAIVALTGAIFAKTFTGFYVGWHYQDDMQGCLVIPIDAFLIWMLLPKLRWIPINGDVKSGIAVLSFALLVVIIGALLGLNYSVGYSIVFAVAGFSLYFLGRSQTKALAFPLAFLAFMVPTPGGVVNELTSPLQRLSAIAVQSIAGLAGISAHAQGVTLYLPKNVTLQVAVGCSGIHSLAAMTMLAALLAYFSYLPLIWKWFLFALALPMALIGNIVRIFIVVLIASKHGQVAGMAFHDSLVGKFVPFLVAFIIVMTIARLLERKLNPPKTKAPLDNEMITTHSSDQTAEPTAVKPILVP